MRSGSLWLGDRNQTSVLIFCLGSGGEISGNMKLPGKLLPLQRVFHRFWPCEKCPFHRFWDFLPREKHCYVKVQRFLTGFSQGLSQVFSQVKNSQGFSRGFAQVMTLWKLPCSQGLNGFSPCEKGVKNIWKTMWNWTVHRFFHS